MGMVVRDAEGDVLMIAGERMQSTMTPLQEEAVAALFGLRYA